MYQELLTAKELAKLLKVSPLTIYRRVKSQTIPVVWIGSVMRFNPAALGLARGSDAPKQPPSPLPNQEPQKPLFKDALLNSLMPEIENAFGNPPAYGDITIRVIMHNAEAVRIETTSSVSKLLSPKPEVVQPTREHQRR